MSEKNMSLYEKIDLIIKRQEQQDKALANLASLIMTMQQFTCGFHKALSIANMQAINPTDYEANAEQFDSDYQRNLDLTKTTKEQMEELFKAIHRNLEINRFRIGKVKITVENEPASSI